MRTLDPRAIMPVDSFRFTSGRRAVAAAALTSLVALVTCTARPAYKCSNNLQCVSDSGERGVCELASSCSFPDSTCSGSHRRFPDAAAADVAGACVPAAKSECIMSLAGGYEHFCLVKTGGTVWCWGANDHGQIGDGTRTDALVPTQVKLPAGTSVAKVSTGQGATCALTVDGAVYCWGSNDVGNIGVAKAWGLDPSGNDNPSFDASDVLVPTKVVEAVTPDASNVLKRGAAPKFTALSVGGKHACAIDAGGDVYCWGENAADQCGYDHKKTGWDDVAVPLRVAGANGGMVMVSLGDEHTQAMRDDGSIFAWGDNTYGEFGNGTKGGTNSAPTKVSITSAKLLAAGDEHACATKSDGSVWCWGYGGSGALGTGDTQDVAQPVHVTSALSVASGGNAFHTCAIDSSQDLQCWGQNSSGEVGTGKISDAQSAAIAVPTDAILPTSIMVATANSATCAVTTDHVLWCWGQSKRGQLGSATATSGAPYPLPQRATFSCD